MLQIRAALQLPPAGRSRHQDVDDPNGFQSTKAAAAAALAAQEAAEAEEDEAEVRADRAKSLRRAGQHLEARRQRGGSAARARG
jgi:hypothetical protein